MTCDITGLNLVRPGFDLLYRISSSNSHSETYSSPVKRHVPRRTRVLLNRMHSSRRGLVRGGGVNVRSWGGRPHLRW